LSHSFFFNIGHIDSPLKKKLLAVRNECHLTFYAEVVFVTSDMPSSGLVVPWIKNLPYFTA
jgi:hypothetical protein